MTSELKVPWLGFRVWVGVRTILVLPLNIGFVEKGGGGWQWFSDSEMTTFFYFKILFTFDLS